MKTSEVGRRFREVSGTGRRGRLCTPGNSQEGNPSHRNWQTKIGTTTKTHAHTRAQKSLLGKRGRRYQELRWHWRGSNMEILSVWLMILWFHWHRVSTRCSERRLQMCLDVLHVCTLAHGQSSVPFRDKNPPVLFPVHRFEVNLVNPFAVGLAWFQVKGNNIYKWHAAISLASMQRIWVLVSLPLSVHRHVCLEVYVLETNVACRHALSNLLC